MRTFIDAFWYAAASAVTVGVAIAGEPMKAPLWHAIDRIILDCRVDDSVAALVTDKFCDRALIEARRDARLPIEPIGAGPVRANDILLHVRIERVAGRPVLTARLTRVQSIDDAEGERATPPFEIAPDHVLATVSQAFDRLFPWRQPVGRGLMKAPSPPRQYQ